MVVIEAAGMKRVSHSQGLFLARSFWFKVRWWLPSVRFWFCHMSVCDGRDCRNEARITLALFLARSFLLGF